MNYDQLVTHFKSRNGAARAIGVSRQSIYNWKSGIPAERQLEIQKLTGGKLRADRAAIEKARRFAEFLA